MKKLLIAIAAALFATSTYANITDATNPHNLAAAGNGACVYCHLVHNANPAGGTTGAPLWARSIRTTGITPYSATRIGTGNLSTTQVSLLCLSCHDAAAGLGTLWTGVSLSFNPARVIGAGSNVGPNLTNDHPVGFTYPTAGTTAAESGLATRAIASSRGYVFYGTAGTIECASCHEPHIWSATTTAPSYKFKRTITGAPNGDFCLGCHDGK